MLRPQPALRTFTELEQEHDVRAICEYSFAVQHSKMLNPQPPDKAVPLHGFASVAMPEQTEADDLRNKRNLMRPFGASGGGSIVDSLQVVV